MTEELNLIASFLARRDVAFLTPEELKGSVDVVALIGSSLLGPVRVAATALTSGVAERLLIAGGIGHSTQDLRDSVSRHSIYRDIPTEGRAEADIMHDILVRHFGIDAGRIIVENQSMNCGANATESKRVLDDLGLHPNRLVIVQDPTMQLRTHASFERAWSGSKPPEFISFAPFVPSVREVPGGFMIDGDTDGVWPFERFVSLILGEVVRLRDDQNGYGPRGQNFIDHVDVPPSVLEAHARASRRFSQRLAS